MVAPPKPSPVGRAFKNKKVSPTGGDLEGAYYLIKCPSECIIACKCEAKCIAKCTICMASKVFMTMIDL